jgi:hypothetical protein
MRDDSLKAAKKGKDFEPSASREGERRGARIELAPPSDG